MWDERYINFQFKKQIEKINILKDERKKKTKLDIELGRAVIERLPRMTREMTIDSD